MRKQARKYWCGPAAIQNALEALGHRVSQKHVAELCGTTEDGTNELQILEGLAALGFRGTPSSTDARFTARSNVQQSLRHHSPALLCVEDWNHWVTLVAPPLGDRFVIVDPADGVIKLIHWTNLERKWRAAARVQTGPLDTTYYAISIGREL